MLSAWSLRPIKYGGEHNREFGRTLAIGIATLGVGTGDKWRAKRAQHSPTLSRRVLLGRLLGGIAVEDRTDHLRGRNLDFDLVVQKADEILMVVTLHTVSDRLSAANTVVVPYRLSSYFMKEGFTDVARFMSDDT